MTLPSTSYDIATVSNPSSALTDFTLMVDLSRMSSAWWAEVDTSDGTKGRAAKDSDETELAVDWIDFDDVAETGWARVLWSATLASSGTQKLRIYPPNSANSSYSASSTYGSDNAYDSGWVGYWPNGGGSDRTSNNNDGTANGGVTVGGVSGKVGDATNFDGTDDYITVGSTIDNAAAAAGKVSFLAWAFPHDDTIDNVILSQRLAFKLWLDVGGSGKGWAGAIWPAGGGPAAVAGADDANATLNTWQQVGMTWDGSTLRVYKDAVLTDSTPQASLNTVTEDAAWGAQSTDGIDYFNGLLDDLQAHSAQRTTAWLSEEYDQTNDQATFWGTWTNESSGTPTTGSSAGSATVSGVGASAVSSTGTSDGTATVTGSVSATAAASGASAGVATVTGVSATIVGSTGTSSGVATVSGVGASTAAASGLSSGSATVTGVAVSGSSSGTSSGVATVSGVGASTSAATGAVSSVAAVTGVGASIVAATGTSNGIATVSGVAVTTGSTGTSAGAATVSGVGASTFSASGTSSGSATVSGVAVTTLNTTGSATGSSVVTGSAKSLVATSGAAAGNATVSGVARSTATTVGTSLGASTVTGISSSPVTPTAPTSAVVTSYDPQTALLDTWAYTEGVIDAGYRYGKDRYTDDLPHAPLDCVKTRLGNPTQNQIAVAASSFGYSTTDKIATVWSNTLRTNPSDSLSPRIIPMELDLLLVDNDAWIIQWVKETLYDTQYILYLKASQFHVA